MDGQRHDVLSSLGLLILRLGAGSYMATHGWGKVEWLLEGKFDQLGDPIGLGAPTSLVLAAGAEFVCAILVMIGLGTRLAALPVAFTMCVAAFVAHGADPWTAGGGFARFMAKQSEFPSSKEPALLFAIVFLSLVFTGAGRFSLDSVIGARWRLRRASNRVVVKE